MANGEYCRGGTGLRDNPPLSAGPLTLSRTKDMAVITTLEELEALYGQPAEASLVKEVDHVTPEYRRLIEASPFAVLATSVPEGLDCSPRGDQPGFVRVCDPKTLLMPD